MEKSVSTDGAVCQMETAGYMFYIDTKFQLEPPPSTSVSAQSVLDVTSDLCVEGGGSITHDHFTKVEPDVLVPSRQRINFDLISV